MVRVTVRYGAEETTHYAPSGNPTVGQVIRDPRVKAELGYADNVRVTIGGVEMPIDAMVSDGQTLTLETRANTKAVLA